MKNTITSSRPVQSFYTPELDIELSKKQKHNNWKESKRNSQNLEKLLPLLPPAQFKNEVYLNKSIQSDCSSSNPKITNQKQHQQQQQFQQHEAFTSTNHQNEFTHVIPLNLKKHQNFKPLQNESHFWPNLSPTSTKTESEHQNKSKSKHHGLSSWEPSQKKSFKSNFKRSISGPPRLPIEDTVPLNLVNSTTSKSFVNYQSQFTNTKKQNPVTPPRDDLQVSILDQSLVSSSLRNSNQSYISNELLVNNLSKPKAISKLASPPPSPHEFVTQSSLTANSTNPMINQSIGLLPLPVPPPSFRAKTDLTTTKQSISKIINNFQYEEPELSQLAEEVLLDLQKQEQWLEMQPPQYNRRYSKAVESFISEDLCVLDPTFTPDLSLDATFVNNNFNQLRPRSIISTFQLPLPSAAFSTDNNSFSYNSMPSTPVQSTLSATFSGETKESNRQQHNSSFTNLLKGYKKNDNDQFSFGHHGNCYNRSNSAHKKSSLGLELISSRGSSSRKKKLAAFFSKIKSAAVSIFRSQKAI